MSLPPAPENAVAHATTQGVLQPGTPGYWRVWGATVASIRPGDVFCYKTSTEPVSEWLLATGVSERLTGHRIDVLDQPAVALGYLVPVGVMRWDTHNLLA